MSDELLGTQLGQYQLKELIGRGGMAKVYKAYQPSLDRYVAIKVLLHRHDPQFAARFAREARAIARLQHYNIVPIYDYSEQDGLLYIAMQYIENGKNLGDILTQPLAPAGALRLMKHLLDALDYAHRHGIVHRDIKPGNILLPTPVWPMLTDFGIAKLGNQSLPALTSPGMALGTPAYMAPEQAYGHAVDARTDLYSTGVVLYEMLTGQVPFEAESPLIVLTKHVSEPPPPPRQINPNLPAAVEPILLKALAKDPAQRYQTATELAADLDKLALQLEENRDSQQLAIFYQAGMQAFKAGQWDEAVEKLTRWTEQNPNSADAAAVLEAAREQQRRMQAEAQHQSDLERARTLGQPTITSETSRSRETSDLRSIDVPIGRPATPVPDVAPEPAPARRSMGIYAAIGVVFLGIIGLLLFLTMRGGTNPPVAPTAAPVIGTGATQAPAATSESGQPTATLAPTTASDQPTGEPLPVPAGQQVLQETFADLNTSGLADRLDDAEFARGPGPQGGYQLGVTNPNDVRWAVLPRQAYTNFTLQVDLHDASENA
ncbi:MAG TPA: protein kinase, partial [Roseiflexaceae bacterium]|nr:protein kinase [Roseiflexaceae bacterium]